MGLQHYTAPSVATLAQADKEFQDALAHLHKPGRQAEQQDPALTANLEEGGSWFLEAVDLVGRDPDALQEVINQLTDQTSDK